MKSKHVVIAIVFGILILLAFETCKEGLSHSGASPYNTQWDGVSNLVEQLGSLENVDVRIIDNWAAQQNKFHDNYSCGIIFLISPEKNFNQAEVRVISNLVISRKFNLVILDEGPYTNLLLKALDLPIDIEAYRYVESLKHMVTSGWSQQDWQVVTATPGFIELGDRVYYVVFSYVAPVTISGNSSCMRIAYAIEGISVGALCRTSGGSVLVIGDGSIAVNAIVPPPPDVNVYTEILKDIVNILCKNSSEKKLVLVDASKYNLRVLMFSELLEEGYGFVKALALTLNPFRYLYIYTKDMNTYILSIFSTSVVVLFIFIIRRALVKRGEVFEAPREFSLVILGYRQAVINFVEELCKSDNQCIEEVPCVLKKITSKCVKQLSDYISRNKFFRKKVIETLLLSKH